MFNMTMRVYDGPPKNRRRGQATAGDCKKATDNFKIY